MKTYIREEAYQNRLITIKKKFRNHQFTIENKNFCLAVIE
jgi:hypothetical protein